MRKRQKVDTQVADLPSLLFEDWFVIRSIDSSKFKNVSRLRGKTSGFDADVILDIHSGIYALHVNETIVIALSSSVVASHNEEAFSRQVSMPANITNESFPSLIDHYEYVMCGKIFKSEEKPPDRRTIYASFGGLLMSLTADKQVVGELELDMRIYLLIRKKHEY